MVQANADGTVQVSTVELVGAEVRDYYWEFDVETLEYVETPIGTNADGSAKSNLFFHNYDFGVRACLSCVSCERAGGAGTAVLTRSMIAACCPWSWHMLTPPVPQFSQTQGRLRELG
jgi:hypothetical protein